MSGAWILLGMMGAGKSSVGRELSRLTGRPFIDTDQLLQNRFGRPVHQIFKIYGEDTFRHHETSVLRGLERNEFVLSTGGGIVSRCENWTELHRLGTTIYLRADFSTLVQRLTISQKRRPLLEVDNWEDRLKHLLAQRASLYERADIVVDLDDRDVPTTARRVIEAVEAWQEQSP